LCDGFPVIQVAYYYAILVQWKVY